MAITQECIWQGQQIRRSIPKTRDPFINVSLLSLGHGEDGEERFWISSWNSTSGSTAVCVTESGKERVYRFTPPHNGFYSVAQEDPDTIWLCGNLSEVVRLTLSTGQMEAFPTGASSALVFKGMVLDPVNRKLFAHAYPIPNRVAFSFDYGNRRPSKVFNNVTDCLYMCSNFACGDGTYIIVAYTPRITFLHWDPRTDALEEVEFPKAFEEDTQVETKPSWVRSFIRDDENHVYIPGQGWFNPVTRSIIAGGPRPEREMVWISRIGRYAWGGEQRDHLVDIFKWDMETGKVALVCTIPDAFAGSAGISASSKIVAVNLYGMFFRYDAHTGELEETKRLSTDSVAMVDCLLRINEERLLGTPFITQAFWELNLRTGEGKDLGRAAPDFGEILQVWKIGIKVYMAAYAGGQLVEYNPDQPSNYPQNPRVVARPAGGQRPVAATQIGDVLYYSDTHKYGNLGCILTRYDTVSDHPTYKDNPVPDQVIRSMYYDQGSNALIVGTTMEADCNSCAPTSDLCYFASLDPITMDVLDTSPAPAGTKLASVCGPLGDGDYYCTVKGTFDGEEKVTYSFTLSADSLEVPELSAMNKWPSDVEKVIWAGKPGLFVLNRGTRFELWNMREPQLIQLLHDEDGVYHASVQEDSLYLLKKFELIILENCLMESE
ncbi:hypothetical protein [Paenibacillus koleovorans]|uniref:hypothetical protein n=1 Tax=Paenibacillus koleovorans TaxID=121608 RepID=UPI000FD8D9EC|nr:hypothetical protein [Paenibacillus koleovorans]